MKKLLRLLGLFLGLLILILGVAFCAVQKKIPKGKTGKEADALAQKMLEAIDKVAWDSTRFVAWTFRENHSYLWDKERHFAQVKWKGKVAIIDINTKEGFLYNDDASPYKKKNKEKLLAEAWHIFLNDSFWLNAPAKCFDDGVTRSIIKQENGKDALLVTYNSGGVTPGDSYLWLLDETGLPYAFKMWVKIVPIAGAEFTWEDWTTTATGAKIAQNHQSRLLGLNIPITDIKVGQNLSDFGYEEDIFTLLEPRN